MDAVHHCERLVRELDKDRFLATLFCPAEHRAALFTLYAFSCEVARVREVAREPLPGEIRLQWWKEALTGERREEALANPAAAALFSVLEKYKLSAQPLVELIDAHIFDLYDGPMQTLDDLENYTKKTASTLFDLAAQILNGGKHPVSGELGLHAGSAYAIAGLLRAFPRHAARGQLYVPVEVLERHGAREEDVFAGKATAELRMTLAEMRLRAHGHLAAANDFLGAVPAAILPALLPLAVVPLALKRMERGDYDPFAPLDIPQWRRQWALWRAAKTPLSIGR
jgi:phytoene synthase